MVQLFKGDSIETKMHSVAKGATSAISVALDEFFDGVYGCIPLGQFLYDQDRVPLSNAIKREVFVNCFQQLFEAFSVSGTFESYMTVLRKIFGDDAVINFIAQGGSGLAEYAWEYDDDEFIVDGDGNILYFGEVFAPGNLIIDVETNSITQFPAKFREIENNQYIEYDFVDSDGNSIVFSGLLGIQTEAELEEVLFVLAPAGIYTQVNLTIS